MSDKTSIDPGNGQESGTYLPLFSPLVPPILSDSRFIVVRGECVLGCMCERSSGLSVLGCVMIRCLLLFMHCV